jgi:hypothetical protein
MHCLTASFVIERSGYPRVVRGCFLVVIFLLGSGSAATRASDFGVVGLIDMPTARMREEGEINLNYATQSVADIFAISYQPTPWLETSFRYTIFNPYRESGSSDELKDRSFEAKLRLLREDPSGLRPAVAVGIRDLLGTGVFSAEYLVASKQLGPLDLSLGVGWGRLAGRPITDNPLAHLHDSFDQRDANIDQGGQFSLANYFSGGNMGMFGGIRYQLPHWNLDLLAEYNSDNYRREIRLGTIDDAEPWSFGVEWEPSKDLVLGASWQQGNQFAARLSATVDTAAEVARKLPNGFGAPGKEAVGPRGFSSRVNWYRRLVADAQASGVLLRSAHPVDEETLNVVYTNQVYQLESDAVHRVLGLVELYAPLEFHRVILTAERDGVLTHSVSYVRRGQAEWARAVDVGEQARRVTLLPPLRVADPEFETNYRYPNVLFSYNLSARTYLFDPDDPFKYQLFARLNADMDLGAGFGVTASWVQNIYDQYDDIERGSDSVLPRVRSDVVNYLKDGTSGLDRLAVTRRGQLTDELYYEAFAGYLEEMYAGAGIEFLHRKFGSRLAFGANLMAVRQRDFDGGAGFRDYETVTGHLSAYWASPLYNLDIAIHAGRYLARDWGATFEVQKRFSNGWSVGAFATLTDVPFSEFGEGSFDKGLIFRVPFNSFTGFNTQSAYRLIMRPLQRDGGQRINGWGTNLWETHRATQFDHLSRHRTRMLP